MNKATFYCVSCTAILAEAREGGEIESEDEEESSDSSSDDNDDDEKAKYKKRMVLQKAALEKEKLAFAKEKRKMQSLPYKLVDNSRIKSKVCFQFVRSLRII